MADPSDRRRGRRATERLHEPFDLRQVLAYSGEPCAGGPRSTSDVVPPEARAQIPFVSYGGIDDWRAEGTNAILIKSAMGRYYRATFMAPCFELPTAEHIGSETGTPNTLDKFDSIIVRGQECPFKSFQEIPKPEKW